MLGAGQQQSAVQPDGVDGGAAAAELVAGDALPDLGHHLVGECDQVPLVDRDQLSDNADVMADARGADGSITTSSTLLSESVGPLDPR